MYNHKSAIFTVWLGVAANKDYIICSVWSAHTWQTKIFKHDGELVQRLPSGEVHLFDDQILVSSNSNDQVVFYSLATATAQPLFDEEFGNMEFEFELELMPHESFGLFTWKPNLAIHQNYTAVEWNSANRFKLIISLPAGKSLKKWSIRLKVHFFV